MRDERSERQTVERQPSRLRTKAESRKVKIKSGRMQGGRKHPAATEKGRSETREWRKQPHQPHEQSERKTRAQLTPSALCATK